MKIGLVCPYDFTRHGAVQKLVRLLDSELSSYGHSVKIITPRPSGYNDKPPKNTIFVGRSKKWNTPLSTTLEVGANFDGGYIDEILTTEHFDVINVHEPEIPVLGAQIASRASCPIIATFHATVPDTAIGKTVEMFRIPFSRSLFKKIAAMTAVSESAARFVSDWSGQKIEIIPNYIDMATYTTKHSAKRDVHTILYLGRLEKRKGVRYLIKAFSILSQRYQHVRLVIAGDGPEKKRLISFVEDNNIPRVEFLGSVDEEKKLSLLKKATVFSSPAIYGESFGVVLLEAMASGTPIVAGDNSGYICVMKDTGLLSLVNPKDSFDFARRLEIFLYDQSIRKVWLNWSKEYIKQFDSKKIAKMYEQVYEHALRKDGGNI